MATGRFARNIEITRFKHISTSVFNCNHLDTGEPVVVEGGANDWPARQWTLDNLVARVGANPVAVRSNTNCHDYRSGTKYTIRQTTFGKYIEDLQRGNARSRNSYMAVQNIKKALPELLDDVTLPEFIGKVHGGPFLWVAPEGHYEYCHMDPDDGLLVVLRGRKEVRLFGCDPEPLYPNPLGSKGRTVQAMVNIDDPDLDLYPKFAEATCYRTTLLEGDMLYIPAFWWHQVTSPETSISVNVFWGNAGTNDYLTKVMKPPMWPAFRYWLLNLIEQNRPFPSFPRQMGRLPETLQNFLHTQWHEMADDHQVESLVAVIMEHLGLTELPPEKSKGKFPPVLQIRGLVWRS